MEQRITNLLKSAFAGINFAFSGIQVLLATTTGIAGFALGKHFSQSLADGWQVTFGLVFAIFFVVGIDGGLDRFFKVLIAKEKPVPYFWIGAVMLTIGTGTFTWFSAAIIGDMENSYITVDEQQRQIDDARDKKQLDMSSISQAVREKKNKIAELEYKMRRDTAAVLSTFRDSHRKLYESGQYKKYKGKSKYATLNASVDRLHEAMAPYQKEIADLKASVSDLEGRHVELITEDTDATVSASIVAYNQRIERKENNRIGLVKFLDIAGVAFLWILFWGIRHMTIKDKITSDVEGKDFLKWAMDYVAMLQRKALETDTKLDDAAVGALASIIKLLNSVLQLFSFTIGLIVQLLNWITTVGQKNGSGLAGQVSLSGDQKSVVNIENRAHALINEKRTVVRPFQQEVSPASKSVVKPAENRSTTPERTTVQHALPTRVEWDLAVEKPVVNTTPPTTPKSVEKSVEVQRKIEAKKPLKKDVENAAPEVLKILPDVVEIDNAGKVETLSKAQVQRRKSANYNNIKKRKTKAAKDRCKELGDFYANIEAKMNDA